jgi:hypothetical protein
MLIFIPTAPGLAVNPCVKMSLYDQCIQPNDIVTVESGLPYEDVKGDQKKRIDNIVMSRNACLKAMKAYFESTPDALVAAMNDADEMHLVPYNLTCAELYLYHNPKNVAVALCDGRFDNVEGHIMLGCWIIHRKFFDLNLQFEYSGNSGECECLDMCRKIRAAGMEVSYLDNVKRLENLK